jgi:hypothetical protein
MACSSCSSIGRTTSRRSSARASFMTRSMAPVFSRKRLISPCSSCSARSNSARRSRGSSAASFLGQRLAVLAAQGEHQVPVFAAQGKVALLGKPGQLGIGHGFLREVGLFDAFAAALELLALQPLGHFDLQRLDQRGHELAQLATLPRGHAQGARALGRVEVVQVAQVRRHGTAGGHGLHQLLQQGGAPAADLAQNEQVVAGLLHRQPKARGGFGPLLADPGQGVAQQLGGVGKPQLRGVEGEPQIAGGQAGYRHGRSGGRVQGALVQA